MLDVSLLGCTWRHIQNGQKVISFRFPALSSSLSFRHRTSVHDLLSATYTYIIHIYMHNYILYSCILSVLTIFSRNNLKGFYFFSLCSCLLMLSWPVEILFSTAYLVFTICISVHYDLLYNITSRTLKHLQITHFIITFSVCV